MKNSIKKYKWWSVLVFCAAMVCACEKQPIATINNPISFGSGRTHVSGEYNAKLWGYTTGDNGYWVFAGTTTEGLTEGVGARYNSADNFLTPAVTRYWADNQIYNFYSVWPVVANNGISDIKFNKTNNQLTFSADISNQNENTDFCIAAAIGEESDADRDSAVNLTYKHALAKVQFFGFSSISTPAELTNLTITVPSSATVTCTLTDDTKKATETDENSLDIDCDYGENTNCELSSSLSEGQQYFTLNQKSGSNSAGTKVLEKLVLPKYSGTVHVSATYKVGNDTEEVETDITVDWQPGKNYIYTFEIQPSGPIIFGNTVMVEPWDKNDTSNDQNLDFDTTKK